MNNNHTSKGKIVQITDLPLEIKNEILDINCKMVCSLEEIQIGTKNLEIRDDNGEYYLHYDLENNSDLSNSQITTYIKELNIDIVCVKGIKVNL